MLVQHSGSVWNSVSESVLHGCQAINDQFTGDPWILFCNGYFESYLYLN